MKKILLYLFLISAFLSCKKEEEAVNLPTPVALTEFDCLVSGVAVGDGAISTDASFGNLEIKFNDNVYNITLQIFNISSREEGDTILFSSPTIGTVVFNNTTYSNTYFDSSKGQIVISKLELSSGIISGNFFFEAQDVAENQFETINITSGVFSNIYF